MNNQEVALPKIEPELVEAIKFFSSSEAQPLVLTAINGLNYSQVDHFSEPEIEALTWLSFLGEKGALSRAQAKSAAPDFHGQGHHNYKRHDHDYREEKTTIHRFNQKAASQTVQQEIDAHFMGETQENEQEVALFDPIQKQESRPGSARIVVYSSDSSREENVPLNLRSFTPNESDGRKLTREEKRALRRDLISGEETGRQRKAESEIRNFGKDNTDIR